MTRLATLTIAMLLLVSSVGCYHGRWAGYGAGYGGGGGCGCNAPGGAGYGAPQGGYMAPQQGAFYSPTGSSASMIPANGPTAFAPPIYSQPYPTTALAPMDPLPTY